MPIQAFEALRYNPKRVKIGLVTAPPYDIISPAYQDKLYERDERNVVRLELGKEFPLDDPLHNRYTRAREFLENWIREGVLHQDKEPAIFIYEQEFAHPDTQKKMKRLAFFAALKLEEFGKGRVYPHEFTFSGPKLDRLKLLAATRTSISPVFGLYEDPRKTVRKLLAKWKTGHPLYSYEDDQGVCHHVWHIADPKKIRELTRLFEAKDIFIADGHHRFETAYNYFRSLNNSSVSRREKERAGYSLACLVAFEDPGLAIFPTHRLVKDLENFNAAAALEKISEHFKAKRVKTENLERTLLKAKPNRLALGFYADGEAWLLNLKPGAGAAPAIDTRIASELILKPVFHITGENKVKYLGYTHFANEAIDDVDRGEAQAALLLRATPVQVIKKISRLRQRMPEKSTYFYPKLATGLVMYRHEL